MQPGREPAGQLLHLGGDDRGDLQRVGVGGLVDGDAGGRFAVELEILGIGLRSHLDPPDIREPDQAAALGSLVLDDDVGELARIAEPRHDVDGVLKLLVLWRRRHADLARCDLLALLSDDPDDVLRHKTERVQFLRIHPDPHRVLSGAHHVDVADAWQTSQLVDEVDCRVVPQIESVVPTVRRVERDKFQDRRGFRANRHTLRLHRLRQLGHCILDAVLHQNLVHIRIGADLERHPQGVGAVIGTGRLHVDHAFDAVHLELDRQSHGVDHGLGARSGIARRHLHGRRHDVGILRDRQAEDANRPDQHQHDCQHVGEDRVLDEEFRYHGLAPVAVGSIVVSCGVTLVPGLARHRSPTTTRSSGLRPDAMTRSAPSS